MPLQGLSSVWRDHGGSYLWWTSGYLGFDKSIFHFLTPVCFLLLAVSLYKQKTEDNLLDLVAGIGSIVAGVLWVAFFLTYRSAVDLTGVVLSIFYWSGAIILFGITFILVGIMYLNRGQLILTRLTGLSFMIVGVLAVIVGYIGGFTFLPWFTVYDFPWVTTAAILPCCLALVSELREPAPLLKDKEGISLE